MYFRLESGEVVEWFNIIGTQNLIFKAWKPIDGIMHPATRDAHAITSFDRFPGEWFGQIGTDTDAKLYDHIPVGESRFDAVAQAYKERQITARDLIHSVFPSLKEVKNQNQSYGEIAITGYAYEWRPEQSRIEELRRPLNNSNIEYWRKNLENDGDPEANDLSWKLSEGLIEEYKRTYGTAYLVRFNKNDRKNCTVFGWEPGTQNMQNAQASAVLPCYDKTLDALIKERIKAPYTGTADDAKRVDAIFARVDVVRGSHLHWLM
jgi:hypothetical protein